MSPKNPPDIIWNFFHFFTNGWEFLIDSLHTYYTFLTAINYTFAPQKLKGWGYQTVKISWSYLQPFLCVTPVWQTDGQKDGGVIAYSMLSIAICCCMLKIVIYLPNEWYFSNRMWQQHTVDDTRKGDISDINFKVEVFHTMCTIKFARKSLSKRILKINSHLPNIIKCPVFWLMVYIHTVTLITCITLSISKKIRSQPRHNLSCLENWLSW